MTSKSSATGYSFAKKSSINSRYRKISLIIVYFPIIYLCICWLNAMKRGAQCQAFFSNEHTRINYSLQFFCCYYRFLMFHLCMEKLEIRAAHSRSCRFCLVSNFDISSLRIEKNLEIGLFYILRYLAVVSDLI